jgi:hypothetical protein
MDKKIEKEILDMFKQAFNEGSLDDNKAQSVGQFLYYHSQINMNMKKLILSLLPELDLKILKLNAYKDKLALIKSLTPNSDKLPLFQLLEKINSVRNKIAHEDPNKMDYSNINQPLLNLFKLSFQWGLDDEVMKKLSKVGKSGEITTATKITMLTSKSISLLARVEELGKKEDKILNSFEILRKFSSLYVRRRFSILMYQTQYLTKSEDTPEEFKEKEAFEGIIKEVKNVFVTIIKNL